MMLINLTKLLEIDNRVIRINEIQPTADCEQDDDTTAVKSPYSFELVE